MMQEHITLEEVKKELYFRVEVTEGEQEEISRADWSTVDAPEITEVKQSGEKIDITVKAVVGNDGADKIVVTLQNEENKEVGNVTSSAKRISIQYQLLRINPVLIPHQ